MVKYNFDTKQKMKYPILNIRLNNNEYQDFLNYCNRKQMTVSQVVRYCLAKEKVIKHD